MNEMIIVNNRESHTMFNSFPDCLSVSQLQEMLCIGKNTAYNLLKKGEIKHRRLGTKYLIPKIYVIEYF